MNRKDTEFVRLLVAALWDCTTAQNITNSLYYALENYMSGVGPGKFAAARACWTEQVLAPGSKEIKDTSLEMATNADDATYKESFENYAKLVEVTAQEFKDLVFDNFKDLEVL